MIASLLGVQPCKRCILSVRTPECILVSFFENCVCLVIPGRASALAQVSHIVLSNLFEQPQRLRHLVADKPIGLTNCGNTCFANSTLQCLFTVHPFLQYFLRYGHKHECHLNDQNTWCFLCALEDLLHDMRTTEKPINPQVRTVYSLSAFLHHVARGSLPCSRCVPLCWRSHRCCGSKHLKSLESS